MRHRDDNKVEAIFDATIQLVNEIGFAETSISKIAKKANVSAATIYIYHENKEDLLLKTYLKVKGKMSEKMFQGFDASGLFQPIFEMFDTGKVQGLFKQEDVRTLIVYAILPVAELAKIHLKNGTQFEDQQLNAAIVMSWDAIKA